MFFGAGGRVDHVGVCVAAGTRASPLRYTHSSGRSSGHDGVATDELSEAAGAVAAHYARRFVSVGRVVPHRPVTAVHLHAATRGL